MNVEIPGEVFKAEKRFLEELLQKIECCNLSLIDLSKEDIKLIGLLPDNYKENYKMEKKKYTEEKDFLYLNL